MGNSIAYPVANPSTGSSFQPQQMKKFTRASVIPSLVDHLHFTFLFLLGSAGHFFTETF
jgi:hypothetical protein